MGFRAHIVFVTFFGSPRFIQTADTSTGHRPAAVSDALQVVARNVIRIDGDLLPIHFVARRKCENNKSRGCYDCSFDGYSLDSSVNAG